MVLWLLARWRRLALAAGWDGWLSAVQAMQEEERLREEAERRRREEKAERKRRQRAKLEAKRAAEEERGRQCADGGGCAVHCFGIMAGEDEWQDCDGTGPRCQPLRNVTVAEVNAVTRRSKQLVRSQGKHSGGSQRRTQRTAASAGGGASATLVALRGKSKTARRR